MKTKKVIKKATKKLKKTKKAEVTMENICNAIDIALDIRFPHTSQNHTQCRRFYDVPVKSTVCFRQPTTWEKFVWGDCDYAPWKKEVITYERKYC